MSIVTFAFVAAWLPACTPAPSGDGGCAVYNAVTAELGTAEPLIADATGFDAAHKIVFERDKPPAIEPNLDPETHRQDASERRLWTLSVVLFRKTFGYLPESLGARCVQLDATLGAAARAAAGPDAPWTAATACEKFGGPGKQVAYAETFAAELEANLAAMAKICPTP